jgi:hypothetical protein
MRMLSSNDRILADEIRSAPGKTYEPSSEVRVIREGVVDRNRDYPYPYPDNIAATYNSEKKGKER